ncbi:excisionase family DNA-binding protein [Corynebacterium yudongzhengii]|uniref:excisionase family DNA-binding protein n=1 Tax=Corynebacterium yudongzhengii TaxID=2080740 RepID=UPI00399F83F6
MPSGRGAYRPLGLWIITDQAAEYLALSRWTVTQKIRRGELGAIKHGKTYRTTLKWCADYMSGKA